MVYGDFFDFSRFAGSNNYEIYSSGNRRKIEFAVRVLRKHVVAEKVYEMDFDRFAIRAGEEMIGGLVDGDLGCGLFVGYATGDLGVIECEIGALKCVNLSIIE